MDAEQGDEIMTFDAERDRPAGRRSRQQCAQMGAAGRRHRHLRLLAWATVQTYRAAPPQPDRFVGADGTVLMTDDDIVAGKGGFQKADLMDYGSLYGMGSYYGEDYTASTLVRLGTADAEQCRPGDDRQAVRSADAGPAGRGDRGHAARAAEH